MPKRLECSEQILHYTSVELSAMRERGEDSPDWARVEALTDEEIEASIDFDEVGKFDWSEVSIGMPTGNKQQLTMRLDPEIVQWFKKHGPGYQTRMNAVLRSYVEAKKAAAKPRR